MRAKARIAWLASAILVSAKVTSYADFKTVGERFREFRTLSLEESALNTPLGQSFRVESRAEVKQPESSKITSQQ